MIDKKRQKLIQLLLEKLGQAMKNIHTIKSFPFGDLQLSQSQIMILFFIVQEKGRAALKDLAKFMRVTPGAITQFIDILVQKKLVVREESRLDRRLISIRLTSQAAKKFHQFKKGYFENASLAFNNLTTEEINQFISFVEKIKNQ